MKRTPHTTESETERWTFAGRDLREIIPLLERAAGVTPGVLTYGLRHSARTGHYSANYWPFQARVTATFGPQVSAARVLEVLLHEICHHAAGFGLVGGPRHGEDFNHALCRAAAALWPRAAVRSYDGGGGYGPSAYLYATLYMREMSGACIWPEKDERMNLADRIDHERNARQWSYEHLAELLSQHGHSISREGVRKWAVGAHGVPAGGLFALADVFGLSVEDLRGKSNAPAISRRGAASHN